MRTFARATVSALAALLAAAAVTVPAQAASAADWCGYVVSAPGTVITLIEDLHCADRGITVRADNVTINLAGYTIYGSPSKDSDPVLGFPAGVMIYRATNTVVVGGTISGFPHGITVARSTRTGVQNVRIQRTQRDGISLTDTTRVTLSHVTVTGPGPDGWPAFGIAGLRVAGFSADSVEVSDWPDAGISLDTPTDVTIGDSVVQNNRGDGISVWGPLGRVVIDRTVASDNGFDGYGTGIVVGHSSASGSVSISHSTARRNAGNGIYTMNATNLGIVDVGADDNAIEGVWLDSGIDEFGTDIPFVATVRDSTANRNVHGGFSLGFAGRWTVSGSRAEGNGDSGFSFYGGQATTSRNVSSGNADNGFSWYEGSRGTSTADTGTENRGYGTLIATAGPSSVTLIDASMTGNRRAGALVSTGLAVLTRGSYSYNNLEGIRASNGSLTAQRVTAFKNGTNGIAFLPGSTGGVDHITASKNGRYGLCITKGLPIGDVPPHVLLSNGIAPRGTQCAVTILGS